MERVITGQITNFVESNLLLSPRQFGFRKGMNCEMAAGAVVDGISDTIGAKQKCLAVFCDVSKAYDMIHLGRLVKKMLKIGIVDKALNLLESYLSQRRQVLQRNEEECEVTHGLPQGSVLSTNAYAIYCYTNWKTMRAVLFLNLRMIP